MSSVAVHLATDNYLNWLIIYHSYCFNVSEDLALVSRCSEDYGKVYLFSEKRRTLSESQKYCKQQFSMPVASDLVVFGSCGEYQYVQDLLLDIANKRRDLWDQENGSKTLETWTKSDRIPMSKGKIYKRSPASKYETEYDDEDDDYVEDETDVTICNTNSTFVEGSTMGGNGSEEYGHRNLTTSFRAWEDGDASETRYPICQLKFDRVFWEGGRFHIKHEDETQGTTGVPVTEETTATPILSTIEVRTEEASEPTEQPLPAAREGVTTDEETTTEQKTTTEVEEPDTATEITSSTVTEEDHTVAGTTTTSGTVVSSLKPPPTILDQSTPQEAASTLTSMLTSSSTTEKPAEKQELTHSAFYEDTNSRIRELKERMQDPHKPSRGPKVIAE